MKLCPWLCETRGRLVVEHNVTLNRYSKDKHHTLSCYYYYI